MIIMQFDEENDHVQIGPNSTLRIGHIELHFETLQGLKQCITKIEDALWAHVHKDDETGPMYNGSDRLMRRGDRVEARPGPNSEPLKGELTEQFGTNKWGVELDGGLRLLFDHHEIRYAGAE